jgi:NAD(P)-dependent dehydrogenase (short-subunit alcohol dehydrogenase family)
MTDLFSVAGKTALVTGGSRGIGLMIARGLVDAGARVYISSRKAAVGEEVAAELSKTGFCVSIPADLGVPEEAERLAAEVQAREPSLDILVNNAGAVWAAPLGEFPVKGWDKVLDVNLRGVFLLTQALVPALVAAGKPGDPARVINIGSVDGIRAPGSMPGDEETYSYVASKAAVHHLTAVLAKRLGPRGVTVNAIAPGPFDTKMLAYTLAAHRDAIVAASPLGRIGEPDDIVGTVIFLSSRAGAYVNGIVIPLDGGMVATR